MSSWGGGLSVFFLVPSFTVVGALTTQEEVTGSGSGSIDGVCVGRGLWGGSVWVPRERQSQARSGRWVLSLSLVALSTILVRERH